MSSQSNMTSNEGMDRVYGSGCEWCSQIGSHTVGVYYIRKLSKFQGHYMCELCIHDKHRRRRCYQAKKSGCCILI